MQSRIAIFAFAVLALVGCDGYAHSFRVSPAYAGGGSLSEHRLIAVATSVARARGYTQKPATQSQYARFTILAVFTKSTSEREWVTLELVRDFKDGADRFIILDWPSFTRSDESRALEAAITNRLAAPQASNQTMQPTAGRRTASLSMTKTRSFQASLAVTSGG
jgi:hypothetical protein